MISKDFKNWLEKLSTRINTRDLIVSDTWSDGVPCAGVVVKWYNERGGLYEDGYTNFYRESEVIHALSYTKNYLNKG